MRCVRCDTVMVFRELMLPEGGTGRWILECECGPSLEVALAEGLVPAIELRKDGIWIRFHNEADVVEAARQIVGRRS